MNDTLGCTPDSTRILTCERCGTTVESPTDSAGTYAVLAAHLGWTCVCGEPFPVAPREVLGMAAWAPLADAIRDTLPVGNGRIHRALCVAAEWKSLDGFDGCDDDSLRDLYDTGTETISDLALVEMERRGI